NDGRLRASRADSRRDFRRSRARRRSPGQRCYHRRMRTTRAAFAFVALLLFTIGCAACEKGEAKIPNPIGPINTGGTPDVKNTNAGGTPDVKNTTAGGTPDGDKTNFGGTPDGDKTNAGGTPDVGKTNTGGKP